MSMADFYVISVHHTKRHDRYITLWRPDDRGYCWRTARAGKYDRERVNASLGYYNNGENIAVPIEIVDAMARPGDPRDFDGVTHDMPISALRAVPNTRDAWKRLIANAIAPTQYPIRAEYPGARRRKDQ
ncbi:hypothetical protein [Bordetella bronchiseptica]|uniref:hypothetical protein n=1 Tax=Bordetella bronchiseptica TaxID=518 RepID=UPI000461CB74|nr:hypothetical protein [Bordetella bronchiseptica]KDD42608.1 hypothetical protein L529_0482 [Bordetella bronchiseptica MBORD901]